jgi:hypothetical protein
MRRLVALPLLIVLALVGCGSAKKHEEAVTTPSVAHIAETEHAEAAVRTAKTQTATQSPASADPPSVTGFGATTAAWNEAHTEDTNYTHEAAYNPNLSLPENDGHPGDEYTDVIHSGGLVTQYEYHSVSMSASDARAAILAGQFPHDATIIHYHELPTCALMLVRSAALAHALGLPAGTPAAQIELETGSEASGHENAFDPASVDGAVISEGYQGIETKGGC